MTRPTRADLPTIQTVVNAIAVERSSTVFMIEIRTDADSAPNVTLDSYALLDNGTLPKRAVLTALIAGLETSLDYYRQGLAKL